MEENVKKVPLTMKALDERLIQLETKIADCEDIETVDDEISLIREDIEMLFDSDNLISNRIDSNKEKIEGSSVDAELQAIRERLDKLESSETVVKELEKLSVEKKESNRRLKTLNATYICRIVLEAIAIIGIAALMVGCSFDFGTPEIKPSDLKNTIWSCVPTVMDGMEVMKLSFDENGIGGDLYFMARGAIKTKRFTTEGNEILMKAPPLKWLFYTDYNTFLNIEYGDKEVEFKRYKPKKGLTSEI